MLVHFEDTYIIRRRRLWAHPQEYALDSPGRGHGYGVIIGANGFGHKYGDGLSDELGFECMILRKVTCL